MDEYIIVKILCFFFKTKIWWCFFLKTRPMREIENGVRLQNLQVNKQKPTFVGPCAVKTLTMKKYKSKNPKYPITTTIGNHKERYRRQQCTFAYKPEQNQQCQKPDREFQKVLLEGRLPRSLREEDDHGGDELETPETT